MNVRSFGKLQTSLRWFLLAGVLTGLLFSKGEGVHLLPFAHLGVAERCLESGEGSRNYSFSITNLKISPGFKISSQDKSDSAQAYPQIQFRDPKLIPIISISLDERDPSCRYCSFNTSHNFDRGPPAYL